MPDIGAFEFGGLPPSAFASELGAYRASDGSWSLDSDGTAGFSSATDQVFLHFSPPNVIGVAGDWTGVGHANIGDFSNGTWHLDLNGNGVLDSGETFTFGQAGDQPIVGDWTGDGITKLGVFRAAPGGITGEFILDTNNNHQLDSGDLTFTFGLATDRIVVGDWTGDGIAKVGVFRDATSFGSPGAAVFTLDTNNNHAYDPGVDSVFIFGLITDGLVIGDWNGSGTAKVGVYRDGSAGFNAPGTALFSLDTNGNLQYDPGVDAVFLYGLTTDQFLAGNWNKTPPLLPSLQAASGVGPGGVGGLTSAELTPVVQQAINDWVARGASAALLSQVQVDITNLDGDLLGQAGSGVIYLDADAAGWGWSLDTTGNPAAGRMDLLTTVSHELGHELGLPDDMSGGVMNGTLALGVRRLP